MKEYSGFATVYDMFMDNVPYEEWADYLHGLLIENGVKDGIVCELGCGTGKMTRKLRDFGYDMIGIDLSQEMLQIATEQENELESINSKRDSKCTKSTQSTKNRSKEKGEILYLNQDMREFELYGSVAAIVSVCDSMNYITEKEDLLQVFKLVNNYLDPGGVFIFDMNTPYYYRKILGEQTICDNRENGSLIWENYYDNETKINEFDITIYISRNGDQNSKPKKKNQATDKTSTSGNESYIRLEETHYQRAYTVPEIKALLKKAGMTDIKTYEVMTRETPNSKSERVYFVSHKVNQFFL